MIEVKRIVKEGFENEFESLMSKKSTILVEKEVAIEKAIEEVNKRYLERECLIEDLLTMISDEVEVEVPDPVVETEDCEPEVESETCETGDLPTESEDFETTDTVSEPEQANPIVGERLDISKIMI